MAVTLSKSFSDYDVANQHLIITGTTNVNPIPSDFKMRIRVFELTTWTTENLLATFYQPLNPAGVIHFDLSSIVRPKVDTEIDGVVIHSFSATPFGRNTTGLKRYKVEMAEYYSGTIVGSSAINTIFLLDGAAQIADGYASGFDIHEGVSATDNMFLTKRRVEGNSHVIYATDEDEGVTSFIADSNVWNTSAYQVVWTIVKENGTSTPYSRQINTSFGAGLPSNSLIATKLLYIPMMPKNITDLFGAAAMANWKEIIIGVYTSAFAPLTTFMRVKQTCQNQKHQRTQLAFKNSLGGWDYLSFNGRVERTIESEGKAYRKSVGTYSAATFGFGAHDRELAEFGRTATKSYRVTATDFTLTDHQLVEELVKSTEVYARVDSSWHPVVMENNSAVYRREVSSRVQEVSVSFSIAQKIQC